MCFLGQYLPNSMPQLNWKRRLGALSSWRQPVLPRRVILLYHALGPKPPAVTRSHFQEQLAWLRSQAEILSLDALLQRPPSLGLQVALTFDDGYASLHDQVAPLLQAQGASATVYVNTGRMGESKRHPSEPKLGHYPDEQFLLWSEVQSLVGAGWSIGSHGVEHLDLTTASANITTSELAHSKLTIENRLQQPCRHFAYTWGRYTSRLQAQVQAAGYHSAASGLHGPLTTTVDPFALPRIDIRADYELADFIAAVSGHWDFLGFKQRWQRRLT
jgi:peptidoglycan/xylan/chitin deacetylase (PgdA/CDA1 family)